MCAVGLLGLLLCLPNSPKPRYFITAATCNKPIVVNVHVFVGQKITFSFLAGSSNLQTSLYILPSVSFFNGAKLAQDLLDRFSRFFHHMESICVNVVNPGQETMPWQPILGKNWRNDLHSAPWHFKTELNIAIWISSSIAQMIHLHRVQI